MYPYLLVGLGGAIGAMARYGAGVLLPSSPGGFPLATFLVNVSGSVAMGLLIGLLAKFTPENQNDIRLFLAVGVFGGFTTFSTFSLDIIALIQRGNLLIAAAYVFASVLLALAGLWGGMTLVRVLG